MRKVMNRIQRLAAFQNPEFYRKQSMRLSTASTPRVISCAEHVPKHLAIPRGRKAREKARRARQEAAAIQRRLEELAGREEQAWRNVERLVSE